MPRLCRFGLADLRLDGWLSPALGGEDRKSLVLRWGSRAVLDTRPRRWSKAAVES